MQFQMAGETSERLLGLLAPPFPYRNTLILLHALANVRAAFLPSQHSNLNFQTNPETNRQSFSVHAALGVLGKRLLFKTCSGPDMMSKLINKSGLFILKLAQEDAGATQ